MVLFARVHSLLALRANGHCIRMCTQPTYSPSVVLAAVVLAAVVLAAVVLAAVVLAAVVLAAVVLAAVVLGGPSVQTVARQSGSPVAGAGGSGRVEGESWIVACGPWVEVRSGNWVRTAVWACLAPPLPSPHPSAPRRGTPHAGTAHGRADMPWQGAGLGLRAQAAPAAPQATDIRPIRGLCSCSGSALTATLVDDRTTHPLHHRTRH